MAYGPVRFIREHPDPLNVDDVAIFAIYKVDHDLGDIINGAAPPFNDPPHIGERLRDLSRGVLRQCPRLWMFTTDRRGKDHVSDPDRHRKRLWVRWDILSSDCDSFSQPRSPP